MTTYVMYIRALMRQLNTMELEYPSGLTHGPYAHLNALLASDVRWPLDKFERANRAKQLEELYEPGQVAAILAGPSGWPSDIGLEHYRKLTEGADL